MDESLGYFIYFFLFLIHTGFLRIYLSLLLLLSFFLFIHFTNNDAARFVNVTAAIFFVLIFFAVVFGLYKSYILSQLYTYNIRVDPEPCVKPYMIWVYEYRTHMEKKTIFIYKNKRKSDVIKVCVCYIQPTVVCAAYIEEYADVSWRFLLR